MIRPMQMPTKVLAVLVALGAVWGAAFVLIKVLVEEMTPLQMAAGRLSLGAATVLVILMLRGGMRRPAPTLVAGAALLAMLDSVVPYMLVGWAEMRIEGGVAAVLMSTMPIFTALIAGFALPDERFSGARIAGLLLAFAGVAVISGPAAFESGGGAAAGRFAVIAAAVSYGFGGVWARVLLRRIDPLSLTAVKLVLGTMLAVALSAGLDGAPPATVGAPALLALVLLGVIATGFAFLAYLWLVSSAGSVRASLVTYVIPVFALLFGAALFGEHITAGTLLGLALILLGVAAAMYAPAVERWARERLAGATSRRVRAASA